MDMIPLTKNPETKIPLKDGDARYGLCCIDIFSKLAHIVPMENRDPHQGLDSIDRYLPSLFSSKVSVSTLDEGNFTLAQFNVSVSFL